MHVGGRAVKGRRQRKGRGSRVSGKRDGENRNFFLGLLEIYLIIFDVVFQQEVIALLH